jgi:hypothetical protein
VQSSQPPKIPTWLLIHFGCSPNNAELLGDLDESYKHGRSRAWYWRQAVVAIVVSFFKEVWSHKLLAAGAIALGWAIYIVWLRIFNLTQGVLFDLEIWSRAYRQPWIPLVMLVPQPLLMSVLSGWLVVRLQRRNTKAAILANAAYFASLSVVHIAGLLYGFVTFHYLTHTVEELIFDIWSIVTMPLGVLIGGGILLSSAAGKRDRAAAS